MAKFDPDNCTAAAAISCSLSVTSDQPGPGEWKILDAHHVQLLATFNEIARTYTVAIKCSDTSGNFSSVPVAVKVPVD